MKNLYDAEHWQLEIKSRKAYLFGTLAVWLAFILMGFGRACGWQWLDFGAVGLLLVSAFEARVFFRVSTKQLERMSARADEILSEELQKAGFEPLS